MSRESNYVIQEGDTVKLFCEKCHLNDTVYIVRIFTTGNSCWAVSYRNEKTKVTSQRILFASDIVEIIRNTDFY